MGRKGKEAAGRQSPRRAGWRRAPTAWLLVLAVGTALPASPPSVAEAAAEGPAGRVLLPGDGPAGADVRSLLVPDGGRAAAGAGVVVPEASLFDAAEPATRPGSISVPADYPTIQAAIDAAATGDTIVVGPGTYEEDLDFGGKGIVLESAAGPAVTVIQGSGTGPVVRVDSEEPAGTAIRGFTITGGWAQGDPGADWGGGVFVKGPAHAVIEGNFITVNRADGHGGGIAAQNTSFPDSPAVTEIRGNLITRNMAGVYLSVGNEGAGLHIEGISTIEDNVVAGNIGGGAYLAVLGPIKAGARGLVEAEETVISGNEFSANTREGLAAPAYALVANNLMINNESGLEIPIAGAAATRFLNNTLLQNGVSNPYDWQPAGFIFANNVIEPREGMVAIACSRPRQADFMWNNDVAAEAGLRYSDRCDRDRTGEQGNIAVDPSFRSRSTVDLRPAAASLLVDTGRTEGAPTDDFLDRVRPSGAGVDIGAYEAPASLGSFGEIAGTARSEETGDGASRVCVAAFGVESGVVAGSGTDIDGRYRIRRLPAGDYLVQFVDCVVADFAVENPPLTWAAAWYGGGTPAPVTVAAGATTTGIDAALFRMGSVRVFAKAANDFVPGRVCVDLVTVDGDFVGRTRMDDLIHGARLQAPPGDYKLFAWDCLDGSFGFAFYQSNGPMHDYPVFTLAEAEVVTIRGGEVLITQQFYLHWAGAAGGTLTDSRTGRQLEGILAVVTDPSGFVVSAGLSGPDGFYLVPGLSGHDAVQNDFIPHRIRFIDPNRAYNSEWWDDEPTLRQADTFSVLSGYYTPMDAALLMRLRCGGVRATLSGTPGPDVIVGTAGPDVIHAQGGADVVDGGGGDDIICGGGAADTLTGGEGADRLYGNIGADSLIGGAGDDLLWGGPGSDTLDPGAGANSADGGPGRDTLTYASAGAAVLVDLVAATGAGWVTDTLAGIENVTGSVFDDSLTGDAGPNILRGLEGDDTLNGGEGDDRIFGGDGEDTADGGLGDDTCSAEQQVGCLP